MNLERVLLPPVIDQRIPDAFLVGPIQGADDWQSEVTSYIHSLRPSVLIANPRRPKLDDKNFVYKEQVDWEIYRMDQVMHREDHRGVIMIWLAKQQEIPDEVMIKMIRQGRKAELLRAHAQTSRFEVGRILERYYQNPGMFNLAVGVDVQASGAKYFQDQFGRFAPKVPVYTNLASVCFEATQLL